MTLREFIGTFVLFCTVGYGLIILGYWKYGDIVVQSGFAVLISLPVYVFLRTRRCRR